MTPCGQVCHDEDLALSQVESLYSESVAFITHSDAEYAVQ